MGSHYDAGRRVSDLEVEHLAAHVERMWRELRGGYPNQPQFSPPVIHPPLDIYQTPGSVVVVVEIPGIRNQEILIELETDRLTIRGEKQNRHCSGEHVYNQMEITCGPFERTVRLPGRVDPEGADVRYEDGYVEIRLPRLERTLERRIRIVVRQR